MLLGPALVTRGTHDRILAGVSYFCILSYFMMYILFFDFFFTFSNVSRFNFLVIECVAVMCTVRSLNSTTERRK